MAIRIDTVIYFYLMMSVSLLVFNVAYSLRSRGREARQARRVVQWRKRIRARMKQTGERGDKRHSAYLVDVLSSPSMLMAYHNALNAYLKGEYGEQACLSARAYVARHYDAFVRLALRYERKDSVAKAYFAYVMAHYGDCFAFCVGTMQLRTVLLSYLDGASVYTTNNVLRALDRLGSVNAMEAAFVHMNTIGGFTNEKLLGDGLNEFVGNKQALAERLWSHHEEFDEGLNVAVVQFINYGDLDFSEPFLSVLQNRKQSRELRMAIMRYFRRHPYAPVKPVLIGYLQDSDPSLWALATVAAFALSAYPGEDTMQALCAAVGHQAWDVRRNAAQSLLALDKTGEATAGVLAGEDCYAREMLVYMMEERQGSA